MNQFVRKKKIPFIIYLFHSFLSITAIFLITGKNINFFNDFVYVIPILNHFHEIDNLKYHPIFRQNEVRNSRAFRISKEAKKKKASLFAAKQYPDNRQVVI